MFGGEPGNPIARLRALGLEPQRNREELNVERKPLDNFCSGVLQKLHHVADLVMEDHGILILSSLNAYFELQYLRDAVM